MTRNQLDSIFRTYSPGSGSVLTLPRLILRLILAFVQKAVPVAGVPTISAPSAPGSKDGLLTFVRSLTPGNGYKLEWNPGLVRLVAFLITRYLKDSTVVAPPVVTPPQTTTYTSTRSYTARCGTDKPGNGAEVTRTETRTATTNQADADAAAQAAAQASAVAVLVCVVPVSYDTLLTGPSQSGAGVTLTSGGGEQFRFNAMSAGDSLPGNMGVSIAGSQVASVDFLTRYVGQGFSFTAASGQVYAGVFTNGNVNL